MSWDFRYRVRKLLSLLAALMFVAAAGCGIDDHDDEDGDGDDQTAPDISGLYTGFFFSRETDEAIAIDQAVFIRVSDSTYRVDFDIDTEDGADPIATTLELLLNLTPVEAVVQPDGDILIQAGQGLLIMSGQVQRGGSRMDGDWLLDFFEEGAPVEDSGTWELFRARPASS